MKMKRPREEDCFACIKAVQKTPKYSEFLDIMKEYKSLPQQGLAGIHNHSNLILGFNILFMPEKYATEEEEEEYGVANQNWVKSTKRVQAGDYYHKDYKFFEKISKEKFRNPDKSKKYSKCLYLYSVERISRVAVLNDSWVSAESTPPGGADTYHFQKNVYENNLQFELVKGAVERVEELLQKIVENKINSESIRLEDHFKVLYLGCLERLYATQPCSYISEISKKSSWKGVVDALPKNAVPVLHDILAQLQKKLKEVPSRLSITYKKKMDYDNSSSGELQDTTRVLKTTHLLLVQIF
ncbi:hypothetical protein MKX03_009307 [Papaver bracteatum]|nr:hypothetical protein MKX03_009307 [Papaver bracteatum]